MLSYFLHNNNLVIYLCPEMLVKKGNHFVSSTHPKFPKGRLKSDFFLQTANHFSILGKGLYNLTTLHNNILNAY